jgi:hypothetical protein
LKPEREEIGKVIIIIPTGRNYLKVPEKEDRCHLCCVGWVKAMGRSGERRFVASSCSSCMGHPTRLVPGIPYR